MLKLNRRRFLEFAGIATSAAIATACGSTTAPTSAPAPTEPPAAATEAPATAVPEATTAPAEGTGKYTEAPMLAEKVAAGELPPVEERLPVDPVVITVTDSIGKHGGTWIRTGPNVGPLSSRMGAEGLVNYDRDASSLYPNLASRYEVSDDGQEFTFYLREGLRWSDGEPLTADDIMFWYEDVLLNEELTPAFPTWLKPGGENVVVEKIDDYTVKFKFGAPYGIFLDQMAFRGTSIFNYPKHYMQQFHPKYADADELAAKVKERGFEQWYQLFGAQIDFQRNPDLPSVHPWNITSADWTTTAVAERNPYYFKVDPEGNQLPYLDKVTFLIVETAESIPMRIVTGEVDHQAWSTGISNYTLYMENREAGNYRVDIWNYGSSGTAMNVNQTKMVPEGDTDAQELADLMRELNFRIGLSKALDRDDINQLVYQGLSDPVMDLFPESVKSDPEIQALFEYNVDEANALLDGLGLTERDSDGMRLLPGGGQLNMIMIGHIAYAIHRDVAEICTEFFREVGIRATMDWIANEVWWPRVQEGDFDIVAYEADYTSPNAHWLTYPRSYFPVEPSTYWAPRWGTWYNTAGREGDEPTGDAAKLIELYDQILITVDLDERKALEDEAFRICASNLWPVHTVASRPEPSIVKNTFHNVPEYGLMAWPVYGERTTMPEQFWKEQE